MLLLPYAGTTRIRFKGFHLRPALFRLAASDMGLSSSQSSPRNGSMVGEVVAKVKDNLGSSRKGIWSLSLHARGFKVAACVPGF